MAEYNMTESYFIAKCDSIASLRKCIETSRWACRDRKSPPHPRDFLSQARRRGSVIMIFSVNNCHGWHGYAEMVSDIDAIPHSQTLTGQNQECESDNKIITENEENVIENTAGNIRSDWHYFDIKWKRQFLKEFGERCLNSQATASKEYEMMDGTSLNKARNWQGLSCDVGRRVCAMIDSLYDELKKTRQEKIKMAEESVPPPFFYSSDEVALMNENWTKISEKIMKELGTIVMACPFGSRRYNLHTPTSDMDMFLVYQASTRDILGFNPPKQTLKSNERESCDFTIHEIFRFGELLLSGDHRCIETLYVTEETLVHTSQAFQQLQQHRHLFVNRNCLDKYLRDACGSKGTKQLRRWTDEKPEEDTLSDRMSKMAYIIIRLLQNAVDIVKGGPIMVYRPDDSQERNILMKIRRKEISVTETWGEINRLLSYIELNKESVPDNSEEVSKFLQNWLIELRRNYFV